MDFNYTEFSQKILLCKYITHKFNEVVDENKFSDAATQLAVLDDTVRYFNKDEDLKEIVKSLKTKIKESIKDCREIEIKRVEVSGYWTALKELTKRTREIILLIESMPGIVGHEGMMNSTLTQKDKIKDWWLQNINNKVLYHGTSSFSLNTIWKYGLAPAMRPEYWGDVKRLTELIRKSGNSSPLGIFHLCDGTTHGQIVQNGFFVTSKYNLAHEHAGKAPATWYEFFESRNYRKAKLKLLSEIFFSRIPAYKKIPTTIYKEAYLLWEKNLSNAYDITFEHFINKFPNLTKQEISPLTKQEYNELMRIFERLWLFFAQEHYGCVLHIDIRAPAIANHPKFLIDGRSVINDFDTFYKEYLLVEHKGHVNALEFLKEYHLNIHQLLITGWIQPTYIKVEELK